MTRPKHRIEGRAKVTGRASYVDDLREETLGFSFDVAVPVTSTVARGNIVRIDASVALAVEGVRLVMTHENAPRLRKVTSISMAEIGERLPLQEGTVRFYGECVAVVVASTLLAAREAAALVLVEYEPSESAIATLADGWERLAPVKRAGMAPGRVRQGRCSGRLRRRGGPARRDLRDRALPPQRYRALCRDRPLGRRRRGDGARGRAVAPHRHPCRGTGIRARPGRPPPGFVRRKLLGHAFAGRVRLTNHLAGGAFGRNLATVHLLLACMAAKVAGRGVRSCWERRTLSRSCPTGARFARGCVSAREWTESSRR
jgi:xanthine dehydrogenase YagR molybdenum-binding subunit